MKLIVGLGNPGPRYEVTRHNVGWLALDRLIDRWHAVGPSEKFGAEVWEAEHKGEKLLLMKPQTFMNLSGKSVGPAFKFYKCKPADLIVLHDEIDLPPMQLRLKSGGGAGGHNGIKSLDEHLGADNNDYHRIRIGVGHPRSLNLRMDPADYVLQAFSDEELERLDALLDEIAKATELLIEGHINKAMTEFNSQANRK